VGARRASTGAKVANEGRLIPERADAPLRAAIRPFRGQQQATMVVDPIAPPAARLKTFVVRSLIMLDEPRNDPSLAALTLEATTASPATMTREPQGRQAAPTSRQPQEENPVSDNSRVCAGTSRQLSSAPAHHALVYSNLCKGQTGRRRRETFVSRSRFPPYHYRPIPVLALNPLAYIPSGKEE